MHILYLANSPHIGGGNRSLLTLWSGLKGTGVTTLAVIPGKGAMEEACQELDIPFIVNEYQQPSWRQPRLSWATYRWWQMLLNDLQVDVVHANDLSTARLITLATWLAGLPLVCHVRYPPTVEYVAWAFRYLPKPDLFIFNSHALQCEVGSDIQRFCQQSRQTVIHNTVDLCQFQAQPKSSHHPLRVGIVANLTPVKGHLDFLEMAHELTNRSVEAEYWIIGEDIYDTGYKKALKTRTTELGIESRIRFLGYCSNVAELLNHLDVMVLSSHVETFGRSLVEAMACKVPVVATMVSGVPEVIEDGVTGLLVPPHAPRELADAVERLLMQPGLRQKMGRAGRERVERFFGLETHVNRLDALYKQVVLEKQDFGQKFRQLLPRPFRGYKAVRNRSGGRYYAATGRSSSASK